MCAKDCCAPVKCCFRAESVRAHVAAGLEFLLAAGLGPRAVMESSEA